MKRTLTIHIEAGEHTCKTSADGTWCQFVRVRPLKQIYSCQIFGKELPDVDENGAPTEAGWLGRLPECKAAEKASTGDGNALQCAEEKSDMGFRFEAGDDIEWDSTHSGVTVRRVGKVVAPVPVGESAVVLFGRNRPKMIAPASVRNCDISKYDRYIVETVGPRGGRKYYTPRTSAVRAKATQ